MKESETRIRTKPFWICMMVIAVGLYLIGCALLVDRITRLAGILLLIGIVLLHAVELKTAMRIGRGQGIPAIKIIIMDMLFGFTWWFPLKNGFMN